MQDRVDKTLMAEAYFSSLPYRMATWLMLDAEGAMADSRVIMTMERPEGIRYGMPVRTTKATAMPEPMTMRNSSTSQMRRLPVISFQFMLPYHHAGDDHAQGSDHGGHVVKGDGQGTRQADAGGQKGQPGEHRQNVGVEQDLFKVGRTRTVKHPDAVVPEQHIEDQMYPLT